MSAAIDYLRMRAGMAGRGHLAVPSVAPNDDDAKVRDYHALLDSGLSDYEAREDVWPTDDADVKLVAVLALHQPDNHIADCIICFTCETAWPCDTARVCGVTS